MEFLDDLQNQFLSSFDVKFIPDSLNLSDRILLEKDSSKLHLRCFLGTCMQNDEMISCSVRELTGEIQQILEIARSEISIFELLNNITCFTKPLFLSFQQLGYQEEHQQIVKYTCIIELSMNFLIVL